MLLTVSDYENSSMNNGFGEETGLKLHDLAKSVKLNATKAKLIIDDLTKAELLLQTHDYMSVPIYILTKKGRQFLEDKGLLD